MRLLIVPLTTKQAFVYCQHTAAPAAAAAIKVKPRLDDRLAERAVKLWTSWETSPTKWKQSIVRYTNILLEKIPYEEYSLKSIPSRRSILKQVQELEQKKRDQQTTSSGTLKEPCKHLIEVVYPPSAITQSRAHEVLKSLAHNGVQTHLKYMLISLGVAPLTLPFVLIPIVPNIPGFYLLYRAWCNWKAWEGAKHLQALVKEDSLVFKGSEEMSQAYQNIKLEAPAGSAKEGPVSNFSEQVLLNEELIEAVVATVEAGELANELHRAVHQVHKRIAKVEASEEHAEK